MKSLFMIIIKLACLTFSYVYTCVMHSDGKSFLFDGYLMVIFYAAAPLCICRNIQDTQQIRYLSVSFSLLMHLYSSYVYSCETIDDIQRKEKIIFCAVRRSISSLLLNVLSKTDVLAFIERQE